MKRGPESYPKWMGARPWSQGRQARAGRGRGSQAESTDAPDSLGMFITNKTKTSKDNALLQNHETRSIFKSSG